MAKKENAFAEEIDLTTFTWVTAGSDPEQGRPGCGGCHPGGGGLEYDRDGKRYDTTLVGNPDLAAAFDGDYYQSQWDKAGVIEADCLICHLPGYLFEERVRSLSKLNFKWAVIAGSGVGQVKGAVRDGETPVVTYNSRLFNEDGKIFLSMAATPRSENCLFCHGLADMRKRGFSWDDRENHDIHNARNIQCAACHPADLEHQFAKGRENLSTVRDDLDGTMKTCASCHESGYMGAPKPGHAGIRPNHLDRLACEACHIPQLGRSSALGLDVSAGGVRLYPRGGADQVGAKLQWYPEMKKGPEGKLYPVNGFRPNIYTNLDGDGLYRPLFAKEIKVAYQKVQNSFVQEIPAQPLINTNVEIAIMLQALGQTLQGNPRFDQIHPCYHSGGAMYQLDDSGSLVMTKDQSWASEVNDFNISHNVAPTHQALGSQGCADCHVERADVFATALGHKDERSVSEIHSQGLLEESRTYFLNQLHRHNTAKRYLTPLLFTAVFVLVFFVENRRYGVGRETALLPLSGGLLPVVTLILLVRNVSFTFLAFTGSLFFFNYNNILLTLFPSQHTAVTLHCISGVVFVGAIIACILVRRLAFPLSRGDICNLNLRGGRTMIALMVLTGAGMLFRRHVAVEVMYVSAITHIFIAFVLIAAYAAKLYFSIIKRVYHLSLPKA